MLPIPLIIGRLGMESPPMYMIRDGESSAGLDGSGIRVSLSNSKQVGPCLCHAGPQANKAVSWIPVIHVQDPPLAVCGP